MDNSRRLKKCESFCKKHGLLIALILACCFFLQVFLGSLQKSLTWDEPSYIAAGYTYLKFNDFRLNPSHPPLMQILVGSPLCFIDINAPGQDDPVWQNQNPVVAYGRKLIFESGNDVWKISTLARLPVMLVSTFLILLMFFWGRQLYGTVPGLFAAAIASFSPNLIAHAGFATEDAGCTVFMSAAVCSFWLALKMNNKKFWILCGVITGLALLSKYTALLLFPIYFGLIVFKLINDHSWGTIKNLLTSMLLMIFSAFVIVGAGYNFSFNFPLYFTGITKIYGDAANNPYPVYLMGTIRDGVHWYYNLAAFIMKVPVPFLLLLTASVSLLTNKNLFKRDIYVLFPAAVIIIAAFFDQANLGLRRILPAFPFLFLFTAQVISSIQAKYRKFAVFMLVLYIIVSLQVYPDHLSFFNVFSGGPDNGPYLLDDSNIDWGQDLPSLARIQKEKYHGKPFKLFYFGTSVPTAYGVKTQDFSFKEILKPEKGIYAISVHNLIWLRKISIKDGVDSDWLAKYYPSARAGHSIYIYEFE